ncbi:MAG: adenylate kinase [Chloroflexi bacterium]|nr:adenylate kinase [Chloroflexota bacterium]
MYVVLLGPPGAGKGSQAPILAERLGGVHISTGDMLRAALKNGTPFGLKAKAYMERGDLVPDDIVLGMLIERLEQADASESAVLDGFPRNLFQAEQLDRALEEAGKGVSCAVNVRVPTDILVERLAGRWTCSRCGSIYHEQFRPPKQAGVCDNCGGELRQRADDRREAVERRLEVYQQETAPLIEFYRSSQRLVDVDGDQAPERVTWELLAAMERCQPV